MALYSPYFMRWKMKPLKNEFYVDFSVNLQEEFADVVARVESLWADGCFAIRAAGGGVV